MVAARDGLYLCLRRALVVFMRLPHAGCGWREAAGGGMAMAEAGCGDDGKRQAVAIVAVIVRLACAGGYRVSFGLSGGGDEKSERNNNAHKQ